MQAKFYFKLIDIFFMPHGCVIVTSEGERDTEAYAKEYIEIVYIYCIQLFF